MKEILKIDESGKYLLDDVRVWWQLSKDVIMALTKVGPGTYDTFTDRFIRVLETSNVEGKAPSESFVLWADKLENALKSYRQMVNYMPTNYWASIDHMHEDNVELRRRCALVRTAWAERKLAVMR